MEGTIDRSAVAPAYLSTADPGRYGGGTAVSGDLQALMTGYENVFGPAAREIKFDSQRHKRHQRWHLPDVLKGSNSFLTDRIDGLITDATSSPFTKNILPYMYMEQPDRKIKWNVYSFDEGIASRVPYESAARVLPQSKRSFAGYAVRQGLAIAMEHNFMMSPQGMENFRRQLTQLVGSIQLTNDLDVHMALLHAPSYQKHMDEKFWDQSKTISKQCRTYVDLFGFMQKNENALDFIIEDAKLHLTQWGSKPPTFMLCNGALTRQMNMNPEKTNYITAGPDGKQKLAQGPDLPSYRGLSIINTKQFSLEAGSAPRDMLRRRVRVCEHYRIPWELSNLRKRYEFYDQSRDSMFYVSWSDLWKASMPSANAEFPFTFQKMTNFPNNQTTGKLCECFYDKEVITTLDWQMGSILGIWDHLFFEANATLDDWVSPFLQDIQIAFSKTKDGKIEYGTFTLHLVDINKNKLNCETAILVVKLLLLDLFPQLPHDTNSVESILKELNNDSYTLKQEDNSADKIDSKRFPSFLMVKDETNALSFGRTYNDYIANDFQSKVNHIKSLKDLLLLLNSGQCQCLSSWHCTLPFDEHCKIECFATDLFLMRPNIEHHMLAVILGRGGGPEELGATFWGQTELSCYDDSQHGIWGMSYKYHERAIVTNERNLVRLFDVCFDGYCGGNDARIMRWEKDEISSFSANTKNLSQAYSGPSFLVMSLPRYKNVFESFPNPIVWHPQTPANISTCPDRGGNLNLQSLQEHCVFTELTGSTEMDLRRNAVNYVYRAYYNALDLSHWSSLSTPMPPGEASISNETEAYQFSFHGHMTSILDGHREETQGSGHLGPNFVGVASVREGRGMLPRGMPMMAHLI